MQEKTEGEAKSKGFQVGPFELAHNLVTTKALGEIARQWVSDPGKLAAAQSELFKADAAQDQRRPLEDHRLHPVGEPELA